MTQYLHTNILSAFSCLQCLLDISVIEHITKKLKAADMLFAGAVMLWVGIQATKWTDDNIPKK